MDVPVSSPELIIKDSYRFLHSGDIEKALAEYQKAYTFLKNYDNKKSFAPIMKSLHSDLTKAMQDDEIKERVKSTKTTIDSLRNVVVEVNNKTKSAYLNFLLKEREFSQVTQNIMKQSKEIEHTKQELLKELENLRSYTGQLKAEKASIEKQRLEQEQAFQSLIGEFKTMQINTGAPEASGISEVKSSDVPTLIAQVSSLIDIGDKSSAISKYEQLRQSYKALHQDEKQKFWPKIKQLASKL